MPPQKRRPKNLAGYLEALSRPVFQAGISWRVIDGKWDAIRSAFDGFDPSKVAAFTPKDIDRLMQDASIVRSRGKIEATVDNAETMLELDREHHGFRKFLRDHDGYDDTAADLKRRFRYIGDSGAYYFLHGVDEPVPAYEEWRAAHPRRGRRRATA